MSCIVGEYGSSCILPIESKQFYNNKESFSLPFVARKRTYLEKYRCPSLSLRRPVFRVRRLALVEISPKMNQYFLIYASLKFTYTHHQIILQKYSLWKSDFYQNINVCFKGLRRIQLDHIEYIHSRCWLNLSIKMLFNWVFFKYYIPYVG